MTDVHAYWLFPTPATFASPFQRIHEMDFTSAAKKRRTLATRTLPSTLHMPTTSHTSSTAYHNIPSPTKHEQDTFFAQLHRACPNAVVLSLHSTYSDSFVPKSVSNMAARHLGQLYDPDITIDNYADILTYCDSFDISVSDAQVDFVMEQTKAQSKSKLWFTMRAGRVTASAFHAACHTRIEKPAMSLLRAICSPNDQFFFCSH